MTVQRTLATTMILAAVWGLSQSARAAEPLRLEYTVVKTFSPLYDQSGSDPLQWGINSTDGLAWDGSGIWMTACGDRRLGKLDENGMLLDEITLPDVAGSDHIAWDGQFLWAVVHSMPNDPGPSDARLIQIDTTARSIINTVALPWGDKAVMAPMGLAWDGQRLWTHHPGTREIYRIDPVSGAGKDQPIYAAPSFQDQQLTPCGISWDAQTCLWISDLNVSVGGGRGGYFQVAPETGEIVSYLVPPDNPEPTKYGAIRPASVTKLFTGMTTDGERVWVVDELEGNPPSPTLDVEFPTTGPCAHPAAENESCVPDGQPFCGKEAVCYGEPGAETCQAACDPSAPSCPEGLICQRTRTGAPCVYPIQSLR